MAITPGDDLKTAVQPIPLGPLFDSQSGKLTLTGTGFFDVNRLQAGEILSGVNRNRANIVQLEADYTAADGALSTAYISADAVVASDAEGARAALSTTLTTAYTAADTALEGTLQADIDTRATIVYVDSVESSLEGSIATQYSTITAEYTAITDGIAGDVSTNAASISTEASARASGDSANASSITTLEARVGQPQGSLIPNSDFKADSTTPGVPDGWTSYVNGASIATVARPLAMLGKCAYMDVIALGNNVDQGCFYRSAAGSIVATRKYLLSGEIVLGSGSVRASGVFCIWRNDANTFLSSDSIIFATAANTSGQTTETPSGVTRWEKQLTAPTGATKAEVYAMGAYVGFGVRDNPGRIYWLECDLKPVSLAQAQVTSIAEAYATDSSATARLVWTVNTSTNAATIEQTAAEGYSDGTWNGSAITLTADEISLRASALNLGSDTTFEDTHDTFYTVAGSYRFRYGGPFGTSSDLLQWYGLDSVSLNSETKTNGVFALATDGKVYFGSTVAATPISITRTNGFVKTKIGSGTNTTNSVSFSATGGNGSYTFTHELAIGSTSGPNASVSSASGSPITVSASGAPVDTVYGTVITTCTDGNGLKAQISSPVALFWET
jgi:hypothetical protein